MVRARKLTIDVVKRDYFKQETKIIRYYNQCRLIGPDVKAEKGQVLN